MSELMNRLSPLLSGPFDLKKLLEYDPPTQWRPKVKGESLSGLVWKKTDEAFKRNGDYYAFKVLHILDSEQRLWKLSCSPVTLKKQDEKLGIRVGHLVACTFMGTGETDEGRTYKKFTLELM